MGCTQAMNSLGSMYIKGHGNIVDQEEGMKWYKKAAELNDDNG